MKLEPTTLLHLSLCQCYITALHHSSTPIQALHLFNPLWGDLTDTSAERSKSQRGTGERNSGSCFIYVSWILHGSQSSWPSRWSFWECIWALYAYIVCVGVTLIQLARVLPNPVMIQPARVLPNPIIIPQRSRVLPNPGTRNGNTVALLCKWSEKGCH